VKVTREQAQKNRAHVVEVAGTEFRKHGFDGIGVADLMKAAGLTHGGFYNNFESKDALAAEAVTRVFAETIARMREHAASSSDPLAAVVHLYLSPEHRDSLAAGCAIAALSQDAARGSEPLRAAFGAGIEGYLDLMVELARVTRARAMAIYSTRIGALTLSRTIPDRALADQILAEATASILSRKESA
jgi:TetR/AcrR family transcriptional repressor of nem operon